jgi:SAM-dependent methyltransferase
VLLTHLDVHAGDRVLDLGCGTGATMVRVAHWHPSRIDGVDVMPAMLRVARNRCRLAGLGSHTMLHLVVPRQTLPFSDETFERAYAESVLGIQDAATASHMLGEIWRVLKPGGRFVANEAIWRQGVSLERASSINASCVRDFGLRLASDALWYSTTWLDVMRRSGFDVVEHRTIGDQELPRSIRHGGTRMAVSDALTTLYRLRSVVVPSTRRRRRAYDAALRDHREDGRFIEPHLFVLQKPADD